MASQLEGVHPSAAAGCGLRDRRKGMGCGRPVPRALDQRALPAISARVDGERLAVSRDRERDRPAHEPGRRGRHVGAKGRCVTRGRRRAMTQCPQPRFTVGEVAGGRTGGRSCTLWHVSYAVLGASLAPHLNWTVLAATALAFFLAVGLAAHALDEVNGRPLRTAIADRMLWGVAAGALAGAVTLGVLGAARRGPVLIPFIVVGVGLVVGYNLELFGGR